MLPYLIAAVGVSAIAAYTDLRTGLIPNWLTLGGIAGGVLGHLAQGLYAEDWHAGSYAFAASVLGIVLCSLGPCVLFVKGGMGGGDVKLFAALGALCHPMLGIEAQLYSFVIVALVVCAKLAADGRLLSVLGASLLLAINPLLARERRRLPPAEVSRSVRLGPAIFAATLLTSGLYGYAAV